MKTAGIARSARYAIAFLLLLAIPGFSIVRRTAETRVQVPLGEVLDDSLIATADTVEIDGTVNGDVIVFARQIELRGTVKGNLIGFAQNLDIHGTVEGSLAAFGQMGEFSGQVIRNLYAFGQTVRLRPDAQVQGDTVLFGATVEADGHVDRSLRIYAGIGRVAGEVKRDVDFAGGRLDVESPARVAGNLTARLQRTEDLRILSGAVVAGKVDTRIESPQPRAGFGALFAAWFAAKLLWFLAIALTGWVMLRLSPKLIDPSQHAAPLNALGLGFLTLIAAPALLFLVAITLVGLPLALIGAAVFATGLYLSEIVVAIMLGRTLFAKSASHRGWALLAGLVILEALFLVPLIGWLARLIVVCLGLGGLVWTGFRLLQQDRVAHPAAV